jgi:hypothetical protein
MTPLEKKPVVAARHIVFHPETPDEKLCGGERFSGIIPPALVL